MSEVVYLYGFVPADTPIDGVPDGIDERPVEALEIGTTRAVISRLSEEAYSAAAVDARMQDLDWVAQRGLAHERVVAWLLDHGEIVPAPLFTLFSSTDALVADARARAADIARTLVRFTGMREWDLKLAYDADVLAQHAGEVSETVRDLDAELADAAPGRRFLLERKRADLVRREVVQAARRVADEVFDELREHVHDAVRLSLPRTSSDLPVVLSAALLVPRAGEADLVRRLGARGDALRPLGIELRFSGPWAAYRFMGGEADAG